MAQTLGYWNINIHFIERYRHYFAYRQRDRFKIPSDQRDLLDGYSLLYTKSDNIIE